MSGLTFLSPMLLSGLLLAVVPVLIHLFFRQQYRRVEWAPMQYLKLSIKKTRRRFRLEQLLLLAMRIGAVMLLFLAVARPALLPQGLGAWVSEGRASRIFLVDDSLSMGHVSGGKTAFERAKDLFRSLLD